MEWNQLEVGHDKYIDAGLLSQHLAVCLSACLKIVESGELGDEVEVHVMMKMGIS